jgi:hypothetical protein
MHVVSYCILNCDHVRCVQLGDGTNTYLYTPPSADVLTSVAAIAAGLFHTCALTTSGGVRCWGGNWRGQASALHAYMLIIAALLNLTISV